MLSAYLASYGDTHVGFEIRPNRLIDFTLCTGLITAGQVHMNILRSDISSHFLFNCNAWYVHHY